MSEINSNSHSKKQVWYKSPWIVFGIFLLLVFMAVSSWRIMLAFQNNPGLVVDDFYERGQDYEENILKKLENNQKWQTEYHLQDIYHNKPTSIAVTIKDKEGKVAPVEKMTLFAYRPSDARQDFSVPMSLSDDKTNYVAELTFNRKGYWDLLASAVIEGIEVNYPKRIFVKD